MPRSTSADLEAQKGLSVQVGSFAVPERAEQLRRRLQQQGYPVRVPAATGPSQGTRYRTPESANQTARHLTVQEQAPTVIAR